MVKLPPIEKVYEAYSAISGDRVKIGEDSAKVCSSNGAKEYTVTWKGNTYTSNDSATYWQGYAGYPVIAVLMLQNRLPLDRDIAGYFKGIDWTDINSRYKGKYDKAVNEIMDGLQKKGADTEKISTEAANVFARIKELDMEIRRGSLRPPK